MSSSKDALRAEAGHTQEDVDRVAQTGLFGDARPDETPDEPEPEVEVEAEEEPERAAAEPDEPDEEPAEAKSYDEQLAELRAEFESTKKGLNREIGKERERRRRMKLKNDALERQLAEIRANPAAAQAEAAPLKVEYDDEGNPIIRREELAKALPQPKAPASGEGDDAQAQARARYDKLKEGLVSRNAQFAPVIERLEQAYLVLRAGIADAAEDGQSFASRDDLLDYIEESGLADEVIAQYPELQDRVEALVDAATSDRALRKLASRIVADSGGNRRDPDVPRGKQPKSAPNDLTEAARRRIREKPAQNGRASASRTEREARLSDYAALSPEEMLALPKEERQRARRLASEGIQTRIAGR